MLRNIKRLGAIAISLIVVTLGIVTVDASPAAAAYSNCPGGQSCLYSGTNGSGSQTNFPFSQYNDNKCHNLTLHPIGGYHSGVGFYSSPYRLTIFHGLNCQINLYDLGYAGDGLTWSDGSITIDSILVTHA